MSNGKPAAKNQPMAELLPTVQGGVNPQTHVLVKFPLRRELLADLKTMLAERKMLPGDLLEQVLENEIIDYRHAQQLLAAEEGTARDPKVRAQLRREELLPSVGFRRHEHRPEFVTGDKADG